MSSLPLKKLDKIRKTPVIFSPSCAPSLPRIIHEHHFRAVQKIEARASFGEVVFRDYQDFFEGPKFPETGRYRPKLGMGAAPGSGKWRYVNLQVLAC